MNKEEKYAVKNQFVGIAEYMTWQSRFNMDMDKRVTKHDKHLVRHDKQILVLQKESRVHKASIGSIKKYFGKRSSK